MISMRASRLIKISLAATVLALSIGGQSVQAAAPSLVAIDTDGLNGADTFFDPTTSLYWTANTTAQDWAGAMAWAGGLTKGGATDWRLPTVDTTCKQKAGGTGYLSGGTAGLTCTGSGEMNSFFYASLEGVAGSTPSSANATTLGSSLVSTKYWSSLVWTDNHADTDAFNWSATSSPGTGSDFSWYFGFGSGETFGDSQSLSRLAWAVTSSPVSAIPEPTSAAMLMAGLGLMRALRRRRKQ